jgi:putative molybdopterin biosynthesis protein
MQIKAGLELFTTAEAAGYLRLKERKLYELVADGAIPCTKVTGKWLFPRGDLDRWLLLQWALSESRAGLAILPEGSESGYRRFLGGEVIAAAIHFHDLDDPAKDANIDVVSNESSLYDAVLIGFATREQGLLVAAGNPLGMTGLADAVAKGARIAFRPDGAGAQQLLVGLLKRDAIPLASVRQALVAPTGPDIAQAIRAGHADCGIATRSVASGAGVDFLPLLTERFDLLMRQRDSYRAPLRAFLDILKKPVFAERAAELGGLDVSRAGDVRWSP